MKLNSVEARQRAICAEYNTPYQSSPSDHLVGVSQKALKKAQPIHGLRHPPEGDASGWYIWADEDLSKSDDFFSPVHVIHLAEDLPAVVDYLGLPAGWRFLLADDYVDVWYDETLLAI